MSELDALRAEVAALRAEVRALAGQTDLSRIPQHLWSPEQAAEAARRQQNFLNQVYSLLPLPERAGA